MRKLIWFGSGSYSDNHVKACTVLVALLGFALHTTSHAAQRMGRAETPTPASAAVAKLWRSQSMHILERFCELLAVPNDAHQPADMERNAQIVRELFQEAGLTTEILAPREGIPAMLGELLVKPQLPTLLLYMHYDGQPAGAVGWHSSPYQAVLRSGPLERGGVIVARAEWPNPIPNEWRLYARSAADDKAPVIALWLAIKALRKSGLNLAVNLKVFLDGEEELGSPHLADILARYGKRLRSDVLIFADGPRDPSGRPQIILGVRGIQSLDLTLLGANHALHSGTYGNWAPNPLARMIDLLASMRAGDGMVRIAGLSATATNSSEAAAPLAGETEQNLLHDLQISGPEAAGRSLREASAELAMNITGLRAGDTGVQARNAIPADATAHVDFRLPESQTPEAIRIAVERHVRNRGLRIVSSLQDVQGAPDRDQIAVLEWGPGSYSGSRADLRHPSVKAVLAVLDRLYGTNLVETPILGGSLPLSIFADNVQVPAMLALPIANADDNQHTADENLRIGNLVDGATLFAELLHSFKLQHSRR